MHHLTTLLYKLLHTTVPSQQVLLGWAAGGQLAGAQQQGQAVPMGGPLLGPQQMGVAAPAYGQPYGGPQAEREQQRAVRRQL